MCGTNCTDGFKRKKRTQSCVGREEEDLGAIGGEQIISKSMEENSQRTKEKIETSSCASFLGA